MALLAAAVVAMGCEPCTVSPITPESLPDGRVGAAYFLQLGASKSGDCSWGSLEFHLVEASLPPRMKLSLDGALDGTPSSSGEYRFTVVASWNPGGEDLRAVDSAPKTYTLTILP